MVQQQTEELQTAQSKATEALTALQVNAAATYFREFQACLVSGGARRGFESNPNG